MKPSTSERAEILIQALPYIQKYTDKIVVVKYGGNAMGADEARRAVMSDIALLSLVGIKVVLVHGGGPEITWMLERLGKTSEFVDGLRVTDKDDAQIVTMVLAGKVNKELVGMLQRIGGNAVGLSGIDANMIVAEQKDERLGYVGNVVDVNPAPILDLLSLGYIPVVSGVGCDGEGNYYNINADTAAARIAAKLGAESLVVMTDVVGIMRDPGDPSTLIPAMDISEADGYKALGIISGGMIPKVDCCVEAVRGGVGRVFIVDGRVPHAILIELLTNEGIGTMFS